ncbi:adhesion G-protein coupled receptor G6-like [Clytia hemisphaerica]|uniref:Uncharacterized protein n=1 Tax=Clytia hemisphaerica TaxID=252671 RepID=A0A7M5U8D1_9CNID
MFDEKLWFLVTLSIGQCMSERYYLLKDNQDLENFGDSGCVPWKLRQNRWVASSQTDMCDLNEKAGHMNLFDAKKIFGHFVVQFASCSNITPTNKCNEKVIVRFTFYDMSMKSGERYVVLDIDQMEFKRNSTIKFSPIIDISTEHDNPETLVVIIYSRNFIGNISEASIWINTCSKSQRGNVVYPFTVAPVDDSIKYVNGSCIPNSINLSTSLYAECSSNGYGKLHGKCVCRDGYFDPPFTSGSCMKCGDNSYRLANDSSQVCRCLHGFSRSRNVSDEHLSETPCRLSETVRCPAEKIVKAIDEIYHFKSIQVGEVQNFSCIYGQTDEAKKLERATILSRACAFVNGSKSVAQWEPLDISSCRRNDQEKQLLNVDLSKIDSETVGEFAKQISKLTSNTSLINNKQTVQNLIKVLEKIMNIQDTKIEVKENVLKILDNIIPIKDSIIQNENKDQLLHFVEKITENIQQPSFNYSGQYLAVSIQTQNRSQATNIKSFDNDEKIEIEFNNHDNLTVVGNIGQVSSIYIPETTFTDILSDIKIISTAYKKDTFFSTTPSNKTQTGSYIMSASIKSQHIENLTDPIKLKFKIDETKCDASNGTCVFWETDGNYWSTRGCTTLVNSKNEVTCECNHLTNFAILFNVYQVDEDVLKSQEVLNYVSLIGCVLSIVGLLATVIALGCSTGQRKTRRKTGQFMIINFCIALVLLLIVFILITNMEHFHHSSTILCHNLSAILHFTIMATFCWTAAQAIFLYKKTVLATKNFQGDNMKSYYASLCLAWGLPMVAAAVTSRFTKSQFDRPDNELCIMKGGIFIYSTIIPIACIILFNLIVFIMVMRKVHGHFKTRASFQQKEDKQIWKRAKAIMICMVLLGLTWIFGFMAVGDLHAPLQWLFCITNTLQGVFVFVFYVLFNDEVRKAWNSR